MILATLLAVSCGDAGDHYAPIPDGPALQSSVVGGVVRDGQHLAIADAVVTLEPVTNGVTQTVLELITASPAGKDASAPSAASKKVTTTDRTGRFTFTGIKPGAYFLGVIASDHLGAGQDVAVPGGAALVDTIVVDVNLTPTGTFSGAATLESGVTHSGTAVYVDGTSYVAMTTTSGAYSINNVPVGSYTVRATHAGYLDDTKPGTLATAGQVAALPAMVLKFNSNIAPTAAIGTVTPLLATLPVDFTGGGADVDGTVVKYEWDFENDGVFDFSSPSTASASFAYPAPGSYTAKLRVTDNNGGIGLAATTLTIVSPVYVSWSTGSDANNGTIGAPVATLTAAYALATGTRNGILMEQGTYNAVPIFQNGIRVLGGRVLPGWGEGSGYTTFTVGTTRAEANSITAATLIRRIEIQTTNATTGNSTAIWISNSTSSLRFEQCRFLASNAPNGAAGANSVPGANGANGTAGGGGNCNGPAGGGGSGAGSDYCRGGTAGGAGGLGNQAGQAGASTILNTFCSPVLNGGAGGAGADNTGLSCPNQGQPGQNGMNGPDGTNSANAVADFAGGGNIGTDWYVPQNWGLPGVDGRGGLGGGGGGGRNTLACGVGGGNGGGGGGEGGAGASVSYTGHYGYGSFGALLYYSSPVFDTCYFKTGTGGNGGKGGDYANGGAGGSGGAGGAVCTANVGRGGNGGNGGHGGSSGAGAGGLGGPSVGVFRMLGSSPSLTSCTFLIGTPGAGGTGGANFVLGTAPSGYTGVTGNIY